MLPQQALRCAAVKWQLRGWHMRAPPAHTALCAPAYTTANLRDEWLAVGALAVAGEVMEAHADNDELITLCCVAVYRLVDGSGQ